jgi:iron complex transport system substrate-binding protein
MKHLLLIALATVSLFSCRGSGSPSAQQEQGDTVVFRYARLIHAVRYDGYTLVTVDNPWKPGKVLHSYALVPHSTVPTCSLVGHTTEVRIPLERSIIFTSVHAALADQLHAQQQVAGVADLKYIKVPFVQEGCKSGRLVDCGDGMNPLVEKIIDARADAILLSPFENSGGYGRLEEIDIPLIECAEYMEASPLARAEWMRFYGMLYGHEHEADSLFAVVDSSYHALKQLALTSQVRRSAIVDKQTGSVWYVPGGCSTIGQMLQDAQCDYPFASDDHSGSLSLPFETVLERAGQAEVWLFRYDSPHPITRQRLLSEQPGYPQLRAVREGELYGCNVMTSMFYEESPFRPDYLLGDFIKILHPDITNLPPQRYYKKVE